MPKITRKDQKIFGGGLVAQNNIAQFGSLKANNIQYDLDPDVIQGLSAFLNGWGAAVVSNQAPALQDMNALFYLITRQLAYLVQTGVPEWNATTTYYIGSVVQDGSGNTYRSLTDTNLNHALTDSSYWSMSGGQIPIGSVVPIVTGNTGAWGPPATGIIKDGYMLCNGAAIPGTAVLKGNTPVLNDDRFLRGSTGSVGGTGGSNTIAATASQSVSSGSIPDHYHNLDNNGGANATWLEHSALNWGFASQYSGSNVTFHPAPAGPTSTFCPYFFGSMYFPHGDPGDPGIPFSANTIGLVGRTANMTSTVSFSFAHTHGFSTDSNLPKYLNCIYVIRVQ